MPSVALPPTDETTYVPAKLNWNTTYYWKVDEMAADGTTVSGHGLELHDRQLRRRRPGPEDAELQQHPRSVHLSARAGRACRSDERTA